MSDPRSHGKRITDAAEVIVYEAKSALKSALRRSRAESLGENLIETVQGVLSSRKRVVMLRLHQDSLKPVDDLVEAGVVSSRSEASAFLIEEGIKGRTELFDRISENLETIRAARHELRDLLGEPLTSRSGSIGH